MSICNKCGEDRPYYPRYFRCRPCMLEWSRAYEAEYRERNGVSRSAAWQAANPEKVKATSRMIESRLEQQTKKAAHHKAHPEIRKNWVKRNPDKVRVYQIVARAIRSGKLIKPTVCSVCNQERRIEAHHEDYAKPLDVVWVCRVHHAEVHRRVS